MRATVRSASGVTSEVSDWVSVGARGDKHEVKRYARELESLCRPLAAVDSATNEQAFMACGTAEFVAVVAERALRGEKPAKKEKAKKKEKE